MTIQFDLSYTVAINIDDEDDEDTVDKILCLVAKEFLLPTWRVVNFNGASCGNSISWTDDGDDVDGEDADGEDADADGEDADGEDADGENADGEGDDGDSDGADGGDDGDDGDDGTGSLSMTIYIL